MALTRMSVLTAVVAVAASAYVAGPADATKTGVFDGRVVHVSTNNIKVQGTNGQTLSFLIVPRFNKIFKANGTTSVQMKDIRAGNYVRVYYDQSLLGARHADRILVATYPLKPMKS